MRHAQRKTMNTTPEQKRVRSSKSRDARFYAAKQSLTIKWRDVIRKHMHASMASM